MGMCLSSTIKSLNLRRRRVKMKRNSRNISPAIPDELAEGMILKSPKLKRFCFNELKAATMNFSRHNILGQGGFGYVYKGWIEKHSLTASSPETGLVVAVKKLTKKASQGQQEWLIEIKYLGQLCHPNLVKLIGYCIEDDERLLVYEFMPNGSLDNSLFTGSGPLSWNIRMKIALGAAKGLAFLHNKAQDYNAKLSDFGFAKDGPTGDKSHLTASILGSYGYLAPEYVAKGENALIGALKAAELAVQCLSTEPELRPTMTQVVYALEQLLL